MLISFRKNVCPTLLGDETLNTSPYTHTFEGSMRFTPANNHSHTLVWSPFDPSCAPAADGSESDSPSKSESDSESEGRKCPSDDMLGSARAVRSSCLTPVLLIFVSTSIISESESDGRKCPAIDTSSVGVDFSSSLIPMLGFLSNLKRQAGVDGDVSPPVVMPDVSPSTLLSSMVLGRPWIDAAVTCPL